MSPSHRRPAKVPRRAVLGILGLAAVPAATVTALQVRSKSAPAEAHSSAVKPSPSAVAPVPSVTETHGGGPVPYTPGKTMLGAYLDLEGKSIQEAIKLRRRQLGRDLRVYHQFYAWPDTLPRSLTWLPEDAYPMISWRGTLYRKMLTGDAEDLIRRNAKQLKRLGRPVLLRWGWEMNGDWYAWGAAKNGNSASGYIKVWKRLREIFAEEKADNVSWVWSPNWNDSPQTSWNAKKAYYPGDDLVDWVGVSGYNLHREMPDKLFGPVYDEFAARKPMMITETGSVDRGGRTKADWTTALQQWVSQHPRVGGVVWFDTDTHYQYEENWKIDTDAASLAAFKAMAQDARFQG